MSDLLNIPSLKVTGYKCRDKYYINAEAAGKPDLAPIAALSPLESPVMAISPRSFTTCPYAARWWVS